MLNKAQIIGHLGRDPEKRYTPAGKAVCNFSVATTEKWSGGGEHTEWHRIVAWEKLAEICEQYLTKGRQVYVEGSIRTRKYQGNDGQDRYTTEIIAQRVQFLGSSGTSSGGVRETRPEEQGTQPRPNEEDDIPF